ncbi:hypothetical protein SOM26_14395 [Sphingomonas sp. CFBP8993]|uniref:hypothetical protein n=1 Tax=Sphingomonas sp. CFBP8993 TaxID=3096526 RepID=UPI002A6A1EBE|nr:hypothetical protein [Sphingomonas sp. CFBP8993]MDY0959881.1 hypothetical protein [Sphingomonas sp. CFBP8993]
MDEDPPVSERLLGKKGSFQQALMLPLVGGIMAFGQGALPILFAKNRHWSDLIQGTALLFPAGIMVLLLVLSMGLKLTAMYARTHDPARTFNYGCLAIIGAIVVIAEAWIIIPTILDQKLAADLVAHGVAANAQLVRSFTAGCGKAACTQKVVYRFTPRGQSQSVEGRLSLSTSHRDHEQYDYVTATNVVPILYDARDPSRAMFFWRDEIANRASPRKMWGFVLVINLIFFAAGTPFALMMAWGVYRQRAKTRAASATAA